MELSDGLIILGLTDLMDVGNLTTEVVNKKYRQLMKLNHPDIGGCTEKAIELNRAKALVDTFIAEMEADKKLDETFNKKVDTILINFKDLLIIYNNESITSKQANGKEYLLDKKNIRKFNTMINIDCEVNFLGEQVKNSKVAKIHQRDEYEIECIVYDVDTTVAREVNIKAYGKDLTINIRGITTSINLKFNGNVNLKVTIERRVRADG